MAGRADDRRTSPPGRRPGRVPRRSCAAEAAPAPGRGRGQIRWATAICAMAAPRSWYSLEEVGPGLWQPETVDVEVDPLVVEGDQAGDGQQLAGRVVIGPREVLVDVAHRAGEHRPVAAGDALVRAGRLGAGEHELAEGATGAIE